MDWVKLHIDDWIDNPMCKDDGEKYAKFVVFYFRYPAWAVQAFKPWMQQFKLFCTYKGQRCRVIGASRLGDLWLTSDLEADSGYEHRVCVTDCSEWGDKP
jgi:hypothetical protein